MSRIRYKWNNRGFYDIRRAPKVVAVLEEIGEEIKMECNAQVAPTRGLEAYGAVSAQGARRPYGRWHVRVYTQTNKAKRAEATDHYLDIAYRSLSL